MIGLRRRRRRNEDDRENPENDLSDAARPPHPDLKQLFCANFVVESINRINQCNVGSCWTRSRVCSQSIDGRYPQPLKMLLVRSVEELSLLAEPAFYSERDAYGPVSLMDKNGSLTLMGSATKVITLT